MSDVEKSTLTISSEQVEEIWGLHRRVCQLEELARQAQADTIASQLTPPLPPVELEMVDEQARARIDRILHGLGSIATYTYPK